MVKSSLRYIAISGVLVTFISPLFATEATTIELPKVPVATKVITVGGTPIKPRKDREKLDMTMPSIHKKESEVEKSIVVPVAKQTEAVVPVAVAPKEDDKSEKENSKENSKAKDKDKVATSVKTLTSVKEEKKEVVKQTPVAIKAKTVAVKADKKESTKVKKVSNVGLAKNGRVSAYLRGSYMKPDDVKKSLESAGFKVLAQSVVDRDGKLTSIVFTNDALVRLADKKNRGFMASLRVLVNGKDKEISISNPLYFSRAFMQDENNEKVIKEILTSLNGAFDALKNSKDKLKYTLLPKYQFMFAMPYFDDMIEVGTAKDSQKLLEKVKGKNLVFTQTLSKDRVLVGVKLPADIANFIEKTGSKNALLLPYPVLIEGGVAKILAPKYYIALSYPKLKMSQFMKISAVPGEIEEYFEKVFK